MFLHFPLKSGQLGYMNDSLQKFLGFDNHSLCYTSFTSNNINKKLKMNSKYLLRLKLKKIAHNHFYAYWHQYFLITKKE